MEPKNELQRNAILRQRRKEIEVCQQAMDMKWLDSRMEDGRMGRCLALIQREAEMEKNYQERTDHAAIVNARAERELALGMEVAKVRREESNKLLRRHYLRERDPSLRQLITKLTAGYVCRDQRQQILHNEYRRLQEKVEEQHVNTLLSNSLFNDNDANARDEKIKAEKCAKYNEELQTQLVNRSLQRQCTYEDTLVEKKMLEELMRTLADEDQRELAQKRMLKERTRNEMITFKKAQEAWKQKQKMIVINEEREIAEQNKMQADRTTAVLEERARVQRAKEELNQKITDKLLADEEKRQERINVIKELQEQEYLEKIANDEVAESRAAAGRRAEVGAALARQVAARGRRAAEQREAEAHFRKETEARIAADAVKEREQQRRGAERARQYAAALQRQIQDNAARRQADKLADIQRSREVVAVNEAWDAEVEAERRSIISAHGGPLRGCLQGGVLRRGDLPALAADAGAPGGPSAGLQQGRARVRPKCNDQCRMLREF